MGKQRLDTVIEGIMRTSHSIEHDETLEKISKDLADDLGPEVSLIFGYGSKSVLAREDSKVYDLFVVVDYLWRFTRKSSKILFRNAKQRKILVKEIAQELDIVLANVGKDGRKIPEEVKQLSRLAPSWYVPLAYKPMNSKDNYPLFDVDVKGKGIKPALTRTALYTLSKTLPFLLNFSSNLLMPPNTYQFRVGEHDVKVNVISRSHLKKIAKGKKGFLERRLKFDDWYLSGRMNKVMLPVVCSKKSKEILVRAQAGAVKKTVNFMKNAMLRQEKYIEGFTRDDFVREYLSLSYFFEGREDFDFEKLYNSNQKVSQIYNALAYNVIREWERKGLVNVNNGTAFFTNNAKLPDLERERKWNKKFSMLRYFKSGLLTYDAKDSIEVVCRKLKVDQNSLEGSLENPEESKKMIVSLATKYAENRKNGVV